MSTKEIVKKYINDYKLNVLPTKAKEKAPDTNSWSVYQHRMLTSDEIETFFNIEENEAQRIGIVCGKISGGLEVIDIDNKMNNAPSLLSDFRALPAVDTIIQKCPIEKTLNGGFHIYYRAENIEGNKKLAMWKNSEDKYECLIETRGEGGYIVCAPSKGYELIQGNFENIPKITDEERETILSAAKKFNNKIDEAKNNFKKNTSNLNNPWDEYNNSAEGLEESKQLLKDKGWKYLFVKNDEEYWTRPGKNDGVSATFRENNFYVFSSNAFPFESERNYKPSVIYTILKHGIDSESFKKTTKELLNRGFGESMRTSSSTDIGIVEDFLSSKYDLRINEVTSKLEFKLKTDTEFRDANDYDISSIYRELQRREINYSYEKLNSLLNSDFVNYYNPFKQYFDGLALWDKHDYIKDLSETVKLNDENKRDYWAKSLRKYLIAMTACATIDGITNEAAITFFGKQGLGKTKWLNKLMPTGLKAEKYLFVGTVNDDKDSKMNLSTKILINLDELGSLNREEIGYLKSLFSLNSISLREPYMRKSKEYLRRASFSGSIDREEFLSDLSGTRRFLSFSVAEIDYMHNIDMDKVFSQAYTLLKNGEQYYFGQKDIEEIEKNNEDFRLKSYEEGLLFEHFEIPASPSLATLMTTTEIARVFEENSHSYKITDASLKKLGQILSKHDFERKSSKKNGVSTKCWLVERKNTYFSSNIKNPMFSELEVVSGGK